MLDNVLSELFEPAILGLAKCVSKTEVYGHCSTEPVFVSETPGKSASKRIREGQCCRPATYLQKDARWNRPGVIGCNQRDRGNKRRLPEDSEYRHAEPTYAQPRRPWGRMVVEYE
ncbi:hypothetical protein [Bifidobacterium callimiconis]|uniref:Uncharacterized protein n=1 Tax=Bifidobacterium callimiconis TaxID=2306973 RepID=A0A430FHP2_9BIFI|nr:hypothetical protein [Bifidobacterium callimiconis]RSX52403.1 hypothetical protein D2E23_0131 [Bifidobacterium callimiconis]